VLKKLHSSKIMLWHLATGIVENGDFLSLSATLIAFTFVCKNLHAKILQLYSK